MENLSGLWELHIPCPPDIPEQQGVGLPQEAVVFNCQNRKCLNDTVNNNKLRDTRAVGAGGDHLLPTKSLLWQFEFMCDVKHSAVWGNLTSLLQQPWEVSSRRAGKAPKGWSVMHKKSGVWSLSIGLLISSSLFRALDKKVTTISLYLVSSSPWGLLMALRQISLSLHSLLWGLDSVQVQWEQKLASKKLRKANLLILLSIWTSSLGILKQHSLQCWQFMNLTPATRAVQCFGT